MPQLLSSDVKSRQVPPQLTRPVWQLTAQTLPLPNTTVTVTSVATGLVVGTTETDIAGLYTLGSLTPGSYLVAFTRNTLSAVHSHRYPEVVRNSPSLTSRPRNSRAPMTLLR